ncbi:hypothetical protein DFJ58DRAFT_402804, partial [Suillus subalutaceus]|uniref:uncharacterized protein n=1 Tax=Suillus subalutaceus TaxID=48586 RepID=UPI001B86959F
MELVSQFTEDAVAQEDHICDRPACRRRIVKNDPCHYVANMIVGQPGRFVCETCYVGYRQKISSSVRPSGQRAPLTQSMQRPASQSMQRLGMSRLPDPQIICQSVNDAQRKSTIYPPPVVPLALSQPSGSGISQTSAPGPEILVPLSWQHSQSMGQHRVAGAAGYSLHHAQYNSERERWAKLSYAPPPAETITLEISAVREGNSQRKAGRGINIGNICEGKKDIDARIDAPGLIALAYDTVTPKLFVFGNGFPWRTNEFTVWDAAWVDLSTHQPNVPYFFSQCLVPSRRGQKAPTFKSKQFPLSVIVPAVQWGEYEEWLESIEEYRHRQSVTHNDGNSVNDFDDGNTGINDFDDGNAGINDFDNGSTIEDFEDGNELEGANSNDWEGTSSTKSGTDLAQDRRAPSLSAKRTHVRAESDSRSSAVSPPRKKAAAAPLLSKGLDALCLPGRDSMREALKYGGSANLNVSIFDRHHEDIEYYPIPTRSLTEILKTPKYRTFELDISDSHIGQLTIDIPLHSMIGIGAFKTAHPGWLTLSPIVSSGLGSRSQHDVVVKRPFYRVPPTSQAAASLKIVRYSSVDELKHVLKESIVMYWAKSLLNYTYDYIDHHISTSPTPPPFEIPRVRFVDAGVALGYGQRSASSKPGDKSNTKAGTVSAVYLLEERIVFDDNQEFTKFIHNMDYVPSLDEDQYGYDLAVFLAFTQHIQYVQTEGLAFVSDYQGSLTLLTDPQILTHPSVNDGDDVFGGGNIEGIVDEFERKHSCNLYCRWPGFGLKPFVSLEQND